MDFPNSEFWGYSTQIWMLPEVESLCLDLQNNYEANVNILLYCCWVGDKNRSLSEDDLQTLLDTAQPWQIIIKPLRDSRKMMQQHLIAMPANMVDQTIANITEMELNAEHMTQLALEKALKPEKISPCEGMSHLECSNSNIELYLSSIDNISAKEDISSKISHLLSAIFQA